jgi:hypothetical protein
MKPLVIFFVVLAFGVVFLAHTVDAAPDQRYAQCDRCGLCQDPKDPSNPIKPSSWDDCARCLYPPGTETLRLVNGEPPKTIPGRFFTQFGCVGIDIAGPGGFTNPNASANVVNQLLRIISGFSGGVAFIYFLYACALFITSRGDAERLGHARKTLTNAIIGLFFTLFAVMIVQLLATQVLRIPGLR